MAELRYPKFAHAYCSSPGNVFHIEVDSEMRPTYAWYNLVFLWKGLSMPERMVWDNAAKNVNPRDRGYNLFVKEHLDAMVLNRQLTRS